MVGKWRNGAEQHFRLRREVDLTRLGYRRSGSTRPPTPSPAPERGGNLALEAPAAEGVAAARRSADLDQLLVDEPLDIR